ncbi:MAG TPA: nuclear transport factor 2 family protein [Solirubrobacterales bacterium]|nr:nuclear transport factor 2 family protein [Solirubrobacterales bacterium]
MSQENVEIVQRFFGAIERLLQVSETSRSLLDAMNASDLPPEAKEALGYLTPDAAWNPLFSGETYEGHPAIARGWDELREAAENYNSELLETTDLENDRVLIVFAVSLEGRASGIHVDAKIFAVVRFQDRLIARIDEYVERREALEAAKLQE